MIRLEASKPIINIASILAIVIDMEVVETKASFLTIWATNISLNNSSSNYNFSKSFDFIFELTVCNFYLKFW